jgi:hypothetical protein
LGSIEATNADLSKSSATNLVTLAFTGTGAANCISGVVDLEATLHLTALAGDLGRISGVSHVQFVGPTARRYFHANSLTESLRYHFLIF